ncbi:xanthine phosphoribosyltransferase [Treponema zuelzerae]|uniref:Xanthine phosphoribosyltransferase n=1 Tax=Teretinema zuelzerae TaxID=156 RepID=A0AAE3EGH6_9SPIR|nr:xanthine phosphoribosyltransferase [Teretinema zuelzerae]MBN2812247.1 xanthine phosphoribosyltransferase [Spirochaetales bacterium]MCD1654249.1 xanthine phosphoribosyltransferase [Teretinema zuelzerae]HPO02321.1 xanthine phosphoribosyltransferase [Treponemataceae bacterium]
MELLKERIRAEGSVLPGNILKVGSFLNQQMDIALYNEMGKEFARRFSGTKISRIVTIEASGIGLACITAQYFNVPVVFAKKHRSANVSGDLLSATITSYTHQTEYTVILPKAYVRPGDSVLVIDDFLANGCALEGLVSMIVSGGATVAGAGIAIEKGFQGGGDRLRARGVRVESLAIVEALEGPEGIVFRK